MIIKNISLLKNSIFKNLIKSLFDISVTQIQILLTIFMISEFLISNLQLIIKTIKFFFVFL